MLWTRPADMKKHPGLSFESEDIVEFQRQDKLIKAESETDFIVEETVVEVSRVNRTDFINSFRDDVGIENILKKVALSGDVSLLNQRKREVLPHDDTGLEVVQDLRPLQEGEATLASMGDRMRAVFAAMPKELTKGMSLEDFLTKTTQADIDAFVAALKASDSAAAEGGKK